MAKTRMEDLPFDYAELHCLSNFSFLRGASHPEELVARAAQLGYRSIAITDECTVSGLVKAHIASKQCGIQLIPGAEFNVLVSNDNQSDNTKSLHLVVLANSRRAYGQMSRLITLSRRRTDKGQYAIYLSDFERHPCEFLVLWTPDHRQPISENIETGQRLARCCKGRLWLSLELLLDPDDLEKAAHVLTLSGQLSLPIVAAGNVLMHVPERQPLQDVISAIRLGVPVAAAGRSLDPNRERYLRDHAALGRLYPPEALAETVRIAQLCKFSLDELRYEYPQEVVPPGLTPNQHLRDLTAHGAKKRWPTGVPESVQALIERELDLIGELAYEHYFLTVYDIVQFARSQRILCQGRGSAANSAVCYCLEITEVDPSRMSVLFERFISKERNEPPDIDVDFEHERREEVIQYIYKRYGRDRAALAATLVTYRPRSAIRDVGKALGLDLSLVDHLAKSLAWWDNRDALIERFESAGFDAGSPVIGQFLILVNELLGFPRHLSQHVGGFVISAGPLSELVPTENAAMVDRTVIQWDKDDLEALGLLKVDVLALGMLSAIRRAIDLINNYPNRSSADGSQSVPLRFADIPAEDPITYHMLQQGDSTGVFQVESRAQMAMLPRLKPACFYDLVIEVAIVRPGPIQGDMVHPYLRRRQKLEAVTYPNAEVQEVLERTLGVPIFQEQVIKLAMVAAGFSAGEADRLRRAMAAWKRRGGLEEFERKLIDGMLARGHDLQFAKRVFAQIKGFGEYGFPESHAASFALLVYVSAWLKRHHPAAFYCALLNSQPMGFYTPSQLVQDARRHRVVIRPVDVQHSHWDHTLEDPAGELPKEVGPYDYATPPPAIRLGLRLVKGFREDSGQRLVDARSMLDSTANENGPQRSGDQSARPVNANGASSQPSTHQRFASAEQLARHAALDAQAMRCLAQSGALEALSGHRYQAHWDVQGIETPSALWQHFQKEGSMGGSSDVHASGPSDLQTEATGQQHSGYEHASSEHLELPTQNRAAADISGSMLPSETHELHDAAHNRSYSPETYAPEIVEPHVPLPAPEPVDNLLFDYQHLGLTLGQHPLALLRSRPPFRRCATARQLLAWRHGQFARVTGVVTGRQRPGTASGVIFMTLEDETGNTNVVIWSSVLERFRPLVLHSRLVMVKGIVEREGKVVHLVAGHLTDLSHSLAQLNVGSRDFH